MSKKQNLIGRQFGYLTVIEAVSIVSPKSWLCQCECGVRKIIKECNLIYDYKQTTSCGCKILKQGILLKPGQKINRLTTISYHNGYWDCICECGKHIKLKTNKIVSGYTKSCGCLRKEVTTERAYTNKAFTTKKHEPRIASARRVWGWYFQDDENCELTFDCFFNLSQQNCFYCGIEPKRIYNCFLKESSYGSIEAKRDGYFIYNGVDRINSNLPHIDNNVVPCCGTCNRAKNNRTTEEFLLWIKKLKINDINLIIPGFKLPNIKPLIESMKSVFYWYRDTDMTLEEFYSITQMNCFYCDNIPDNCRNVSKNRKGRSEYAKQNGNFIYSGLDRIDSNLTHIKSNIVPCCIYCNFAKSNLSLAEFFDWIKRVQNYQK